MKVTELRKIIKEEISNVLNESSYGIASNKIKSDFIDKLANELRDTVHNWDKTLGKLDMGEAAEVILDNADLPEGMDIYVKNSITTDDIISRATNIEFGMDKNIKTVDFATADIDVKVDNIDTYLSDNQRESFYSVIGALGKEKTIGAID